MILIIISFFLGSALGLFAGGIVAGGSERTINQCNCDKGKE